ncbi:low molecular weight protein-tyrosine-phosphatase [Companilactobacillus pabuli]|jgi:protein-tyrosine phosphatase|uniref:protein-tyrosine-phosphatase n=1 Tax=Companilactobacillus pabuli TaxID=2714036 RepID=A0A7L7KWS0_9LACO|nr:low molecular weight protein-tyrosine-phosphatase [Companilactobacillus pabuli]AKP04014.1 protein tyrosine phosphatase [Companilactobacillus farciminis]AKS52319.1 protein tyrosine phosphatase [Companilactobacillus farciminis]MDG5113277.1 low molecular weight phosphotyrosine protein phosphatase [Companilactobacillus pabuli]QMT83919.1 low molecular weight phosphotyrosine protein phosphatase [Companilactobacillus pabuli]GAQ00378.1 protein tyrosine phosphatase [Companilactobacillus farciminis]
MKKIIFVCLGNICRSPMAEMMMKHLIEEKNLSDQITVASRSTSTYEIGNSPHPGAIAELKNKKIPIIDHHAQQITRQDFDEADVIIGMDQQNIVNLQNMAPSVDKDKIHLAYEALGQTKVIEDPWYDHKFGRTYKQLAEVLPVWLKTLLNQ